MSTTEQNLNLTPAEVEDLQTSFAAMNALEFAKHLHTLNIPDSVKSEWLAAKVQQKPSERDDAMQKVIENAMLKFWSRLAENK